MLKKKSYCTFPPTFKTSLHGAVSFRFCWEIEKFFTYDSRDLSPAHHWGVLLHSYASERQREAWRGVWCEQTDSKKSGNVFGNFYSGLFFSFQSTPTTLALVTLRKHWSIKRVFLSKMQWQKYVEEKKRPKIWWWWWWWGYTLLLERRVLK